MSEHENAESMRIQYPAPHWMSMRSVTHLLMGIQKQDVLQPIVIVFLQCYIPSKSTRPNDKMPRRTKVEMTVTRQPLRAPDQMTTCQQEPKVQWQWQENTATLSEPKMNTHRIDKTCQVRARDEITVSKLHCNILSPHTAYRNISTQLTLRLQRSTLSAAGQHPQ